MDKEILEQLQSIQQGMMQMEQRLSQEIKDTEARMEEKIRESEARTEVRLRELETKIQESETRTEERIRESEVRTKILIENKVTDRIDALVDGYKTTHEKQWELEHRTEQLQSLVEDLQVRVAVLEGKTA